MKLSNDELHRRSVALTHDFNDLIEMKTVNVEDEYDAFTIVVSALARIHMTRMVIHHVQTHGAVPTEQNLVDFICRAPLASMAREVIKSVRSLPIAGDA
jgi:hypothetical protein